MVNKRESNFEGERQRKSDEEVRANPPRIVWERVRGGIWVQRSVEDHGGAPGRRPRPPCECIGLYGSVKRRVGAHHGEKCPRRHPW